MSELEVQKKQEGGDEPASTAWNESTVEEAIAKASTMARVEKRTWCYDEPASTAWNESRVEKVRLSIIDDSN